jgi:GNAT superfamily N-acetyltransferase
VLDRPWVKDYDAIPGNRLADWVPRLGAERTALLAARSGGRRVGGAIVASADEVATIWDLRVEPELRRRGVGSALFRAAETWARARGRPRLEVETQNVNVSACRFYARHGCVLGEVRRFAYPELPDEIQLLWYKLL